MKTTRHNNITRQRLAKRMHDLGPMTKYQISETCHLAIRNVNAYLKILREAGEVYIHSWIRVGNAGGPWTRVWGYGKEKDAKRPKPLTAVEKSRKRRQDPEVCIQAMMQKRAARHHKRMEKLYESTNNSLRAVHTPTGSQDTAA